MPLGVIGNTTDFGSGESRFETWRGNEGIMKPLHKPLVETTAEDTA